MSIPVLVDAGADREATTGLASTLLAPKNLLSAESVLRDMATLAGMSSPEKLENLHAAGRQAAAILQQTDWTRIPDRMRNYRPRGNAPGIESTPFYHQCTSYSPIWHLPELALHAGQHRPEARRLVAWVMDELLAYIADHSTADRYQDWIKGGSATRYPLLQYHSAAALAAASLHGLLVERFTPDLQRLMAHDGEVQLRTAVFATDYSENFLQALSPLRLLLSYRHEDRHPRNQGVRRKGENDPPPQVPRTRQEDDGLRVTSYARAPDRDIPDDVVDEATEESSFSALIIEDSPGSEKPIWQYIQEARYRRKHFAKSNLFAPLTLRALSDPEVCRLEGMILGRKLPATDAKALAAMLLLGLNLNDAKTIVACKTITPAGDTPQLLIDTAEWRIPVKQPSLTRSPRVDALSVQKHLCLPIPCRWRELLLEGINVSSDAAVPLLPEDLTEGKIRSRLKKRGLRLRLSRVSAWLSRALFLQTFQHNSAALMTNSSAPHNVTLRHYEHPIAQAVRDDYLRVLVHLEELTGTHLPDLQAPLEGRIGTPTASPPDLLWTWVRTVVQQLKTMPVDSLDSRYEYCNLYARYCRQFLAASLLLRGTTDPDYQVVDPQQGLVIVNDKDRGGKGAMSRLTLLDTRARQQLAHYEEHRSRLVLSRGMGLKALAMSWPIFKREPTWHVAAMTLVDLVQMEPGFPGTDNAFRKFAHTRLAELGLGGELLDAISGHWHPGMEPHSRFSALCPRLLVDAVRQPLASLITEMGFEPLRSRLP